MSQLRPVLEVLSNSQRRRERIVSQACPEHCVDFKRLTCLVTGPRKKRKTSSNRPRKPQTASAIARQKAKQNRKNRGDNVAKVKPLISKSEREQHRLAFTDWTRWVSDGKGGSKLVFVDRKGKEITEESKKRDKDKKAKAREKRKAEVKKDKKTRKKKMSSKDEAKSSKRHKTDDGIEIVDIADMDTDEDSDLA